MLNEIFHDPFASDSSVTVQKEKLWFYGPYEYEAFRLAELIRAKEKACLKVGYPGEFHRPNPEIFFCAVLPKGTIHFRVAGTPEFFIHRQPAVAELSSSGEYTLILQEESDVLIRIVVADLAADVPAFLPETQGVRWLCASKRNGPYVEPYRHAAHSGLAPHREELARKEFIPQKIGETLWDSGFEMLCFVEILSDVQPEMFVGETLFEVENENPEHFEQTCALEKISPGRWRSVVPLALRYIRLKHASETTVVRLSALYDPAVCRGTFSIAQDRYEEIREKSVYTLHLCMHHFLIDGVKRDRLPWGGDLAVSLLANAYTFFDKRIIRDTITVLESAGIQNADINGIADYSLWLLINHDLYQRYFADPEFLQREYPRVQEMISNLLSRCDMRGFLTDRCDWIFLDWLEMEKTTALQILFVWALKSARKLAERRDDSDTAERCANHEKKLAEEIRRTAFDSSSGLFRSSPGGVVDSRHPNIFAILSELVTDKEAAVIAGHLADSKALPPVGTPYVAIFEALALARGGYGEAALKEVECIWGGMLNLGATTFYEAYAEKNSPVEHFEFYGRPYGLSCCHAWSSGPAFFFPLLFSGLEPEEDGWKSFRSIPMLECPHDFSISVPTPSGTIRMTQKNKIRELQIKV